MIFYSIECNSRCKKWNSFDREGISMFSIENEKARVFSQHFYFASGEPMFATMNDIPNWYCSRITDLEINFVVPVGISVLH